MGLQTERRNAKIVAKLEARIQELENSQDIHLEALRTARNKKDRVYQEEVLDFIKERLDILYPLMDC